MPIESREPSLEARDVIETAKKHYSALELFIIAEIPESRERALALTNLEQSFLWAAKACCMGTIVGGVPK